MRRLGAGLLAVALLAISAPAVAAPGPPDAPEYWFDSWQVPSLWASGARGQGMTIAEIDTGVNAALPELAGRILPGKDFGEPGDGRVDREVSAFGHGTAMASIMVARPGLLNITGLAPEAKILPIAVPLNGTSDEGRPDQLGPAIEWAADHGAKIISMSLGSKRSPGSDPDPCPAEEQQAVFHALDRGAVVLASVGNTGPTDNVVEEPGACLGVVSVGAVDRSGTVARFSARQPYLTLVAPGVGVPSLGRVAGEAYSGDGTSQATAIASAVLALAWSRYPRASAQAIVARLLATLDARRSTPSRAYGYGVVDAYRAVTATVAPDAPNPVYAAAAPFRARAGAFARGSGIAPPRPAAARGGDTGRVRIGSASSVPAQAKLGIGIAGAGMVLVGVAVVLLVRRRRARDSRPSAPGSAWTGG